MAASDGIGAGNCDRSRPSGNTRNHPDGHSAFREGVQDGLCCQEWLCKQYRKSCPEKSVSSHRHFVPEKRRQSLVAFLMNCLSTVLQDVKNETLYSEKRLKPEAVWLSQDDSDAE